MNYRIFSSLYRKNLTFVITLLYFGFRTLLGFPYYCYMIRLKLNVKNCCWYFIRTSYRCLSKTIIIAHSVLFRMCVFSIIRAIRVGFWSPKCLYYNVEYYNWIFLPEGKRQTTRKSKRIINCFLFVWARINWAPHAFFD